MSQTSPQPVSLKSIAARLGVHPSTVSMALRGIPRMRPEVRDRIVQTAREMGYTPNASARDLRTQRSNLVGMLSNLTSGEMLTKRILRTIRLLHAGGYEVMNFSPDFGPESLEVALRSMASHRVPGLLLAAHGGAHAVPPALTDFLARGAPYVLFYDWPPGSGNVVDTDRAEGLRQAVQYLAALGHRRIVLAIETYQGELSPSVRNRIAGWKQGLRECGLPAGDEGIVSIPGENQDVGEAAAPHFADPQRRPTAVIAQSDLHALHWLRFFAQRGLRVPRDVSLVGFDGSEVGLAGLTPLTTMSQPIEELAQAAAQKMVGMIRGEIPAAFAPVLIPPVLVVRGTTGPAPAEG